jgi:hypothetical protein
MRRYDIVSGILLILSIIDFALAAPVLVQEKRQASVDVVHIPKDVITVLEKRGSEEVEKLVEEYFKAMGKPAESSDSHASSSSSPPGPDHGSTDVVQAPVPLNTPGSSEYGSDHELTGAHALQPNPNPGPWTDSYFDLNYWFPPVHEPENQVEHVQQPNPGPSTDSNLDWNYWTNLEDPPPPRPASPKELGQAHENPAEHVQQPNPGPLTDSDFDWNYWSKLEDPAPRPASPKELGQAHENPHVQQPNSGPSTDSDFDWNYWANLEDPPPPRPASQKEFGQAHGYQVEHVQQLKPGPSTDPDFDWNYWTNLEDPLPLRPASSRPSNPLAGPSNPGPSNPLAGPSNPGLPTEPELHSDHQSSSADSQPEDLEAAITYAWKGKAKESRSNSGTASDVGNAAQRELQPAERPLDPGE